MRTQLRLFLARFNEAIAAYTLARLETQLRNPAIPEAPLLQRLGSGSEGRSPSSWPHMRKRIDALSRYVSAVKKGKIRISDDLVRTRLLESARRVIELRDKIEALHAAPGPGSAS